MLCDNLYAKSDTQELRLQELSLLKTLFKVAIPELNKDVYNFTM